MPPPEMGSSSDTLAIPGDLEGRTTLKFPPEDGASAAWLVANIRSAREMSSWRESLHGLATAQPPVSLRAGPSPKWLAENRFQTE